MPDGGLPLGVAKKKAIYSLRSLRTLIFKLLMKASFQRIEKLKPFRFRGKAFSLSG